MPRIGEFRPALEKRASEALGLAVSIGTISAKSDGLVPSFELRDVVLADAQGRPALQLPRVLATLSPRSLWHRGFEHLVIEQPALDVRRDAAGRVWVAGIDLGGGGGDDSAADWFFSQPEFVVRGGMVRWTDEQRAAPPVALEAVDLAVRNRGRRHQMRVDATPPATWGQRFTVTAQMRQPLLTRHNGRWRDWIGQIYADFPQVDVDHLDDYADLGGRPVRGRGALRAWVDVQQAAIAGVTADLALSGVSLVVQDGLQPLALQTVSGRLGGRKRPSGFDLFTQDLRFVTGEGQAWPAGGNLNLAYTDAQGRSPAKGELRADALDLGALAQVGGRLPLGTATLAALTAYAPQGQLRGLQASWSGALGAPQAYAAKGRLEGFALAAQHAGPAGGHDVPGIRGAAIDFDLTQAGGRARLELQDGALEFPGLFEEPVLPFDSLRTNAQWQLQKGGRIAVQFDDTRFANTDTEGELQARWHTGEGSDPASRFPGVLDLQGSLGRADGARVWRYLPTSLPAEVRHYVRDAVLRGKASDVRFKVRGDLHHVPAPDAKQGEFRISAQLRETDFAYVPPRLQAEAQGLGKPGAVAHKPWPALLNLSGELVFDRLTMQVRNARAQVAGAPGLEVTRADATIPDLAHSTTVAVTGELRGPLASAVGMVGQSAIGELMGHALDRTTASGNAEVRLKLHLPVHNIVNARVQGSVTLAGNDIQVVPDAPALSRVRGMVAFSESGFALQNVQGRALGGDVRVEGGMRTATFAARPATAVAGSGTAANEPLVQVRVQGTATAEGLRDAQELGLVARLARQMEGSAAYSAVIGVRQGAPEVLVSSNLRGMAVQLPAPLRKPADSELPLRFETVGVLPAAADAAPQDRLRLQIGDIAAVEYLRDTSAPQPRVLRGGIGVGLEAGESMPLPDSGVAANVHLAVADVDAWIELFAPAADAAAAPAPAPAASAAPATGAAGAAQAEARQQALAAAMGYVPTTLALRAGTLSAQGRVLHDVVVGGSREGAIWRANVEARELNGYVEYRQPSSGTDGLVYARLARLNVPQSAAGDVESLLEGGASDGASGAPDALPALDIVVDELELKGRKLGKVEVNAVNRGSTAGGRREWRLNRLAVTLPEASFAASGRWADPPAPARGAAQKRRTEMDFRLDIRDSGALLARFGMHDVVRGGRGRMAGQVAWGGSPLGLDYPSLGGKFNVDVASGQFLKADPGLAKLLGVLSLQALPRRLVLDFRDVFSEGFAFDFVRGDVRIDQGVATTNNLQMKGVNAAVLMDGRADIAHETQDLRVVVVPEINAGTAALVATAINPAVGLGTFLAQLFLSRPLAEAATQEFRIDGTWSDPKVAKVAKESRIGDNTPP